MDEQRNPQEGPWVDDMRAFTAYLDRRCIAHRDHTNPMQKGIQVQHAGHWMGVLWNKHFKRYTADRRLALIVQSFAAERAAQGKEPTMTELEKQLAEALRGMVMMDPAAISAAHKALAAFNAQQAAPVDEREAFEAWAVRQPMNVDRWAYNTSMYVSEDAAEAWEGWQARAALASQPAASVALTDEQIDEIMRACHLSAIETKDYRAQRFSGMTWDEREDYGRALRFARAIEAAHGIKPLNALVTAPDPAQQEQR